MSSLKSRLNLGVFVVSLIFFSSLIIANIIFFNSFGEDFVSTRLQHDTDALLVALKPDETGKLQLDENNLNPIFLQPFSGHYYRIETDHNVFLSRSLWDQTISLTRLPIGDVKLFQGDGPEQQKLLILEGSYFKEGQNIWIFVSEDYAPITNSLRPLSIALLLINGGVIILLMLIQRFIVNKGMAPLKTATEELSRLGSGEKYFLNEQVPEEVLPLVQEINKLMVMVDHRIKRSTTALGNLAHALKTPLAYIEQSVTVGNKDQVYDDVIEAVEQIKHQLDSELKRARITGSTIHGQRINISEFITPLIATLKIIYKSKNISFILDIEQDAIYVGDRYDLMELFGNLLDNACKWAKKTVIVSVKMGSSMNIMIEDDGPGITSEKITQIENRGIRLDETGEGHGLGLSIVREIIDLHQAQIKYSRSEQYGGLKVSIDLSD